MRLTDGKKFAEISIARNGDWRGDLADDYFRATFPWDFANDYSIMMDGKEWHYIADLDHAIETMNGDGPDGAKTALQLCGQREARINTDIRFNVSGTAKYLDDDLFEATIMEIWGYVVEHVDYDRHCVDIRLYINNDGTVLTGPPTPDAKLFHFCRKGFPDKEWDEYCGENEDAHDKMYIRMLRNEVWLAYLDFVDKNCTGEDEA